MTNVGVAISHDSNGSEWRLASGECEWRMVGADPCVCHKAISHDGKRQRLAISDWRLVKRQRIASSEW